MEVKRVFNHLKLSELETTVNSLTWVLGTKFRSSGRTAITLNSPATSPAYFTLLKIKIKNY